MYEGDGHTALTDGGGDSLDRPEPHVAARKDAWDARPQEVRVAVERPAPGSAHVGACEHVTAGSRKPCGLQGVNVRPRRELVDEITRHALLEPVAAAEDRHAPCVGGEKERRLPCVVACT
jgi:hypothetical protein